MSLSNVTVRQTFTGDGSTTAFAIPFAMIQDDSSEVKVYTRDNSTDPATVTLKTENTDYTLTGATSIDTFHTTVTFSVAPASGIKVILIRQLTLTQPLDATANGSFRLVDHEEIYDRLAALIQQLDEKSKRGLHFNITSPTSNIELPEPVADQVIGWNAAGTALELKSADDLMDLAGALLVANNLSDLGSVSTALTNLGISPLSTQVSHNVTDGQAATNLTGETTDGATYSSVMYEYECKRGTTVLATGYFSLHYKNSTWEFVDGGYRGDTHGLTFSISQASSTVQLRVALDSGAGNGTIKLKKHRFTA